jgi:hypothetical protein
MADYSDLSFNASDTDYVEQLVLLTSRSEAVATEVEGARQGEASLDVLLGNINTEIVNAREGEASLLINLGTYLKNATFTSDVNLNGFRVINAADGIASTDLATVSQATALILGGASPTNIAITSIGSGTATSGQRLVSNGTIIVAEDNDLLSMNVGALTANQVVGVNAGATALEGKDLTTISSGSLTNSQPVMVKTAGGGLADYDNDLEIAMSSLFMYSKYG